MGGGGRGGGGGGIKKSSKNVMIKITISFSFTLAQLSETPLNCNSFTTEMYYFGVLNLQHKTHNFHKKINVPFLLVKHLSSAKGIFEQKMI